MAICETVWASSAFGASSPSYFFVSHILICFWFWWYRLFIHDFFSPVVKRHGYQSIGGIGPEKEDYQAIYHALSEIIQFTGKIRLAKDFIEELYIHMGYQKPTAFKTVLDITLRDGRVVEINDRSQEIEQKRGAFKKHYKSGDMLQTIDEAFSLDMDFE